MFIIEIKNLDNMVRAFNKAPAESAKRYVATLRLVADRVRQIMKNEAPQAKVQGGRLKRSINSIIQGTTAVIGPRLSEAPYAIYVHEGTRAHEIRPRIKKALYWKGARHPVRLVHHPGTAPNPFVERTVKKAEPEIQKAFDLTTEKILNTIKF